MNNKLRKQILKELNFLLNEVEINPTGGVIPAAILFDREVVAKINEADIDNDDGFNYINLTDFGKMVNQRGFDSYIEALKSSDINNFDAGELSALKRVCDTKIVLIDEFGTTDPYFYVKCQNGKPVKVLRLGYEGDEAGFGELIKKFENTAYPPTPEPSPSPQPKPDTSGAASGEFGKSFQCKPGAVAKFQKWLRTQGQKISTDDKFGRKTFAAAKAVGNEKLDFSMYSSLEDFRDQNKKNQLCSNIENDSRWNQMTESKNFYDNKKLIEAKLLYDKLTKNLV